MPPSGRNVCHHITGRGGNTQARQSEKRRERGMPVPTTQRGCISVPSTGPSTTGNTPPHEQGIREGILIGILDQGQALRRHGGRHQQAPQTGGRDPQLPNPERHPNRQGRHTLPSRGGAMLWHSKAIRTHKYRRWGGGEGQRSRSTSGRNSQITPTGCPPP